MNSEFEYMPELDIFSEDEPQEVKNKAKGVLSQDIADEWCDSLLYVAMGDEIFEEKC